MLSMVMEYSGFWTVLLFTRMLLFLKVTELLSSEKSDKQLALSLWNGAYIVIHHVWL